MIRGTNLRDALTLLQAADLGQGSGTLTLSDGRFLRLRQGKILDCTLPMEPLLDNLSVPWVWRDISEENCLVRTLEKSMRKLFENLSETVSGKIIQAISAGGKK